MVLAGACRIELTPIAGIAFVVLMVGKNGGGGISPAAASTALQVSGQGSPGRC